MSQNCDASSITTLATYGLTNVGRTVTHNLPKPYESEGFERRFFRRHRYLTVHKFRIFVETYRNRPRIDRNRCLPICAYRAGYFELDLAQLKAAPWQDPTAKCKQKQNCDSQQLTPTRWLPGRIFILFRGSPNMVISLKREAPTGPAGGGAYLCLVFEASHHAGAQHIHRTSGRVT